MLGTFRLSKRVTLAAAAAGASAMFLLPGTHASAATVTIPCTGTNATDVAALTAAITAANIAGNQTLSLASGCTFTLSTVDNTGSHGANGLPAITSTMTIQGNGDTITRSTGANTPAFRFFETSSTGNLTLTRLTLSNGAGSPEGGAIYGVGPLTINTSTLSGNATTGDAGAIFDSGVLSVTDSSLLDNSSPGDGGAIASEQVVDNTSYGLTVIGSTFSANHGGNDGGAIHTDNVTVVINSTLTGNDSPTGGAFFDNGTATPGATILDTTIDGNTASTANGGGGIANTDTKAQMTVTNTIVADNSQGNCGSATGLHGVTDGGHNLENGTSCGFTSNAVNAEPALEALADNSGPTFTMELGLASPAYSKGDPAVCAAAMPNGAGGRDQRHKPRKMVIPCDIGAYEQQRLPESPTPTAVPVPATGAVSAGSSGPSTGLALAGGGAVLVLGSLIVVGRRRGHVV